MSKLFRVKKEGSGYRVGAVIQLNEKDAKALALYVEELEQTNTKKAAIKGIKSLVAFAALFSLFGVKAIAGSYSVDVASYPITEVAYTAAEISGRAIIEKLVISNSTTTMQTFNAYSNCASTTTATAILTLTLPANVAPMILDYREFFSKFGAYTDLCFRKSDNAAKVYLQVLYR